MILVVALPAPAIAQAVGDPAPRLTLDRFLHGQPVQSLEHGQVHVIEFCTASPGPFGDAVTHLIKLRRDHPQVKVVVILSPPRDGKKTKETYFGDIAGPIKELAHCSIALDAPAEGSRVCFGLSKRAWVLPTLWRTGKGEPFPCAFLIDQQGKIAWIGEPAKIWKPLEQVLAGKWDLATAAGQFRKETIERAFTFGKKEKQEWAEFAAMLARWRRDALTEEERKSWNEAFRSTRLLGSFFQPQTPRQVVKQWADLLTQEVEKDPQHEVEGAPSHFMILAYGAGRVGAAAASARRALDEVLPDEPWLLNGFAWCIASPGAGERPRGRLISFALEAALRAESLTQGKDPSVLETLARAHFVSGDRANAIATQERLVQLARGTSLEKDQSIAGRLKEYRTAPIPELDWGDDEEPPSEEAVLSSAAPAWDLPPPPPHRRPLALPAQWIVATAQEALHRAVVILAVIIPVALFGWLLWVRSSARTLANRSPW